MKTTTAADLPARVASPSGLSVELNANGSVRRMTCGDIQLNVFLGNEAEGGPANIVLRRLGAAAGAIPLLGPASPASYRCGERGFESCGSWGPLRFRMRLVLAQAEPAWFWHVEVENAGTETETFDLLHLQDLALAHAGAVRLNEYYVCHYVDHTPLAHPRIGLTVASRQNQSMGGRCPWSLLGSLGSGVSYATDALQVYGLSERTGGAESALRAGLPGKRLQGEHALVAIQDAPVTLPTGAKAARGFFGLFRADKPAATCAADAACVEAVLALPEAAWPEWAAEAPGPKPAPSLFVRAPLLDAQELEAEETRAHFGAAWRHAEYDGMQLLSFFADKNSHVVLKAKELRVLRPHGHLLRTGGALTPDESALTSTAWMGGVFHSMVTQGHVSINRFLSTCHSYLGLFRSHGQRVFVELDGRWHLLGCPSAFDMRPDACRWIYKHPGGVIEASAAAPDHAHELRLSLAVLQGPPVRFLISHHVALNGDDGSADVPAQWSREGQSLIVRAVPDSDVGRRFPDGSFVVEPAAGTRLERVGGDELLFADGATRRQPFLCLVTEPAVSAGVVIRGRLVEAHAEPVEAFWDAVGAGLRISAPPASPLAPAAQRAGELFPWLIQNALVHYLSPRGLEQYSGGGWGTRDVCQGPVEMLLALGRFEPLRDLLLRVFRQQNADGDWPQWFMFFDRERAIRPGDSHGDIVFWPLLALSRYLSATGDARLLEETLPFFHALGDGAAEQASLLGHVDRALELIARRVIAGTSLAAYGHGDWNDALQPADPDMRERLCSSWTVTLSHQTLSALAAAFRRVGRADRAAALEGRAASILDEFQRLLIVDGVLTGLAYFHEGGRTDYLLHPRDSQTGLSFSLLPLIHAVINDLFSPAQAEAHLGLIRRHLLGPDGAHLFDRPMAYHGGVQTYFQRVESASYFGREIGLMYTHAHLRYAEALAHVGDADRFFRALEQVNPIGLREVVPAAGYRQANCYYSSSDPAFADRYEAFAHYDRALRGEVTLEGGWRVYSSGAGIGVRLLMQDFLGLRQESGALVVDPVIPPVLDGLMVTVRVYGCPVEVTYRIEAKGCGVVRLELNGTPLGFTREGNPYRTGAARIAKNEFADLLTSTANRLCVQLA